ncbi:hypothetical protein ASD65_15760 [Microbacterium sp. Root61]|uniref:signal peptidase I n=1 Tax=Microbacterium sp. Root61 TaxID=1736570 RepID=UPI0006F22BA8|nr:signal peptidase I [Microbacterium sp. Root61]KRA25717.1 hypothetical protein ASD65_15760 [Microbacterium sp. Root61]
MSPRRRFVGAAAALVVAAAAAMSAQHVALYRAESGSMRPTVEIGDVIVGETYRGGPLERGTVVIFTDPDGWAEQVARLTDSDAVAPTFVKRVLGLPGDRVACCDSAGRLSVNGRSLSEEYRLEPAAIASVLAFDVMVPDDTVFVLGDSREASVDSRYLGPVPVSSIVATRVVALRW